MGIGFGAYQESLSANTMEEDNSITKQTHEDFLKRSNKMFRIHFNLQASLVWGSLPDYECCYSCYSLLLSLDHAEIFVQNTSFVRSLSSFHHSTSSAEGMT